MIRLGSNNIQSIEYNLNVKSSSACLTINQITVYKFAALFICMPASNSIMVMTLSYSFQFGLEPFHLSLGPPGPDEFFCFRWTGALSFVAWSTKA